MQQLIRFTKLSGAGNDFVLIDNRNQDLLVNQSRLAAALCSRRKGIGADGLLLLESSPEADFSMRYYNADGSSGGMCGNGGRCIARYAFARGLTPKVMRFEALDHIYSAEVIGSRVKLRMKDPERLRLHTAIRTGSKTHTVHYIHTGSPHVVIFCEDPDSVDLANLGPQIRFHERFLPEGTNVNVVSLSGTNGLRLRTYERGVEEETLACGTGAVASAIIASILHSMMSPLSIRVKSGEDLLVYFNQEKGKYSDVYLEGSTTILFEGNLVYDTETDEILDLLDLTSETPQLPRLA